MLPGVVYCITSSCTSLFTLPTLTLISYVSEFSILLTLCIELCSIRLLKIDDRVLSKLLYSYE